MEEQAENPKPESLFNKLSKKFWSWLDADPPANNTKSEPACRNQFEKAVADAEFMLIYASTNRNIDIKRKSIEILSKTKLHVKNMETPSPEEEADFWLVYQELCKLVRPATAESIKANLPLERTFSSWLLEDIFGLFGLPGSRITSKVRKSMSLYVVFTVLVLLLVLFFQIYWVIGNQLFIKLDNLLQAERDLSIQITENSPENNISVTQSNQDLVQVQLTGIEKKQQSLESQLVQTLKIFLKWSKPWYTLINKGEPGIGNKYDSQLKEINDQIIALEQQVRVDPDGSKEAANNEDVLTALKSETENKSKVQSKIDLVTQKSALDALLTSLNEKELEIQDQKEKLIEERSVLENQKADLVKGETDIKLALNTLKDDLASKLKAEPLPPQETLDIYKLQIDYIDNLLSKNPDFGKQAPQSENNRLLTDQATQLNYIVTTKGNIKTRLDYIDTQTKSPDQPSDDDLKRDLTPLLNNPEKEQNAIYALVNQADSLQEQLSEIDTIQQMVQDEMNTLQGKIDSIQVTNISADTQKLLDSVADKITNGRKEKKLKLEIQMNELESQAQAEAIREDSSPAQLVGRFVLDILQSYLLPLLYGILGAATFAVRSLSRQIRSVRYSETSGVQYLSHISLGAMAGILVGWFSFLIPNDNFIGSISPMAIAFLVGYNIELLFSKMDELVVTKLREIRQRTLSTSGMDDQKVAETTVPSEQPGQEISAREES